MDVVGVCVCVLGFGERDFGEQLTVGAPRGREALKDGPVVTAVVLQLRVERVGIDRA